MAELAERLRAVELEQIKDRHQRDHERDEVHTGLNKLAVHMMIHDEDLARRTKKRKPAPKGRRALDNGKH